MNKIITIAGNSEQPLTVNRLGYGTMRLTGPHIYGEPANRDEALDILKQTRTAGINFFDTADYYGEDVTNRLIREALYPYESDLVICTKVGGARRPDKSWIPYNTPQNLRDSIENNLKTLGQDQIQLVHFRVMPGTDTSFEKSMEAMYKMQQEGKILHVGVSNVSPEQLKSAMQMGEVATVENMYSYAQRETGQTLVGINAGGGEVLSMCEENEIPLIPYFSLVTSLPKQNEKIEMIAKKHNATVSQVNISWLLHKSPWILPIPGTSSLKHFRENVKAIDLVLSSEDMESLG